MSSTKPTGGPAFPLATHGGSVHKGMDLRDWLAGRAMQGMVSNINTNGEGLRLMAPEICKCAYEYADAMLAARAEVKP